MHSDLARGDSVVLHEVVCKCAGRLGNRVDEEEGIARLVGCATGLDADRVLYVPFSRDVVLQLEPARLGDLCDFLISDRVDWLMKVISTKPPVSKSAGLHSPTRVKHRGSVWSSTRIQCRHEFIFA